MLSVELTDKGKQKADSMIETVAASNKHQAPVPTRHLVKQNPSTIIALRTVNLVNHDGDLDYFDSEETEDAPQASGSGSRVVDDTENNDGIVVPLQRWVL